MTAPTADRSIGAAAIRPAEIGDIPAITLIYGRYVRDTTVTFETEAPDEGEMERRWHLLVDKGFPYLVAELEGRLSGFAFATPYKPRAAYAGTVEESIYVAAETHGKGIGTKLMAALILMAEKNGYRQMIAGIADDGDDVSLTFHRKFGFEEVGRLTEVGHKFERLIDVVLMQRALGPGK